MEEECSCAWKTVVFNLAVEDDRERFESLCQSGKIWQRFDTLREQLLDLIKTRNPKRKNKLKSADFEKEIEGILNGVPIERFGRWIYYPWSGNLVHLLPSELFVELRLNRNQHKITAEEQARLSQISVGVVGLSVGNAVALTLALEGSCGHLKLADFDHLELSNMNRLRADVTEIGLSKAVLTARQIFELNPYAQITLFNEGLSPDNIDQFFCEEPKLDIVIDECDEFRMKVMIREQARAHQIPCLMETAERGMVDVERFDLEPQRPILHGLMDGVTSADIGKNLSDDEKLKLVLSVAGFKGFSDRIAASMVEIGQTISTWPQLASGVVHGGASMTVATRRIALGLPLPSGRRYIDIDQLLTSGEDKSRPASGEVALDTQLCDPELDRRLPDLIRFVVEYGALAPSGGNSQPWRFRYDGDCLWVLHDEERSRNLMDPQHYAAYLALGAAIENMTLAADSKGYETDIVPFPDPENRACAAKLRFINKGNLVVGIEPPLFAQIKTRVTNRQLTEHVSLDPSELMPLVAAGARQRCQLHLLTARPKLLEVGEILGEGDRIRFLNAELHAELISELRWTPEEAARTRNGIGLPELELTIGQEAAMQLIARSDVVALLNALDGGQRLAEGTRDAIVRSSAVGLITIEENSPVDLLRAGRGLEQIWLQASKLGLAMHPTTAPLYLMDMPYEAQLEIFSDAERSKLAQLRVRLNRLFPHTSHQTRLMLFRLSKGTGETARSLRYPISDILHYGAL
ncbi:MAG: Rv1355c family protein [Chloroflexota bacterium]